MMNCTEGSSEKKNRPDNLPPNILCRPIIIDQEEAGDLEAEGLGEEDLEEVDLEEGVVLMGLAEVQ
jgi:hypothetical protein